VLTRLSSPEIDPKLTHVVSLVVSANVLAAQIALKLDDRERARETLRDGLAAWGSTDAGADGALAGTLQWARTTLQPRLVALVVPRAGELLCSRRHRCRHGRGELELVAFGVSFSRRLF
jgi:hypothetical protein